MFQTLISTLKEIYLNYFEYIYLTPEYFLKYIEIILTVKQFFLKYFSSKVLRIWRNLN